MAGDSGQAFDKNYNLITVLQQSLQNVWAMSTYIDDAQSAGDDDLVEFFEKIKSNNEEAAQRAKAMLNQRLEAESE